MTTPKRTNPTAPSSVTPVGASAPAHAAALKDVIAELRRAQADYPPFASAHEGYAIILEELDELWIEVMKRPDRRLGRAMRDEAKQVAAMALRFMIDVCGEPEAP
jgi:hypothetical protein